MKTLDKERKKRLTKDVRFTEDSWSRFINVFPFFFPFLVEEENLELSLKTTCCLSDRRKQLKQHTQTLREKKGAVKMSLMGMMSLVHKLSTPLPQEIFKLLKKENHILWGIVISYTYWKQYTLQLNFWILHFFYKIVLPRFIRKIFIRSKLNDVYNFLYKILCYIIISIVQVSADLWLNE